MITIDQILAAAGVILPVGGGILGWNIKRHQEITKEFNSHDKRLALVEHSFGDLKELINSRFDALDNRLDRVERKVLNGDYQYGAQHK